MEYSENDGLKPVGSTYGISFVFYEPTFWTGSQDGIHYLLINSLTPCCRTSEESAILE